MIEISLLCLLAMVFYAIPVLYYIDYTIIMSEDAKERIIPGQEGAAYLRTKKDGIGLGTIAAGTAIGLVCGVQDTLVYTIAVVVAAGYIVYIYVQNKKCFYKYPNGRTKKTSLKEWISLALCVICVVLTFIGAHMVILSDGHKSPGYAVIPMCFSLSAMGFYRYYRK